MKHLQPLTLILAALALDSFLNQPAQAQFFTTGSLNTPRYLQTATLLNNGQVLVTGGVGPAVLLSSAELFDPATGTFTATGSLGTNLYSHTATLLPDGKVLVAGGIAVGNDEQEAAVPNAELYDPVTGTWTDTGSMHAARAYHTATLLTNGLVLVSGGEEPHTGQLFSSAELFNPATGKWTLTGSLTNAHAYHTATLLTNGTVLVAAGISLDTNGNYAVTNLAELYNPVSGKWTATGPLTTSRENHTATLLPNGEVLVAGGTPDNGVSELANAELYNPSTKTWTATGPLNDGRYEHTANLLPNGQVLVTGGIDALGSQDTAELYDPASGTWTNTVSLNYARYGHTATLLTDGQVLVAGGPFPPVAELFASAVGTWTNTESLAVSASQFGVNDFGSTATLLPNGQVLVAAGYASFGPTNGAELFNPATGVWTNTGSLKLARYHHTATLLPDGQVLVTGGIDTNGNDLLSAELYNPSNNIWRATGSLNTARSSHTATLLPDGEVLVAGGIDTNGNDLFSAELYNATTGQWTATGSMLADHFHFTATLLPNGQVLVVGGGGSAELYDPADGMWTLTGSLNTGRFSHTATLLPSGEVLVAGGADTNSIVLSSAELYDPAVGTWTAINPMTTNRFYHTATLLPNGQVLVAGGQSAQAGLIISGFHTTAVYSPVSSAELFDPATGIWTATGPMTTTLIYGTATLLTNGQVLAEGFAGEGPCAAELFNVGLGFSPASQPQIATATSPLHLGASLTVTGSRFRGVSQGSGGNNCQDSPADYPLVQLRSVDSGQTLFLAASNWTKSSFTSLPVDNFPVGYALVTAFVNGTPGASVFTLIATNQAPQIIVQPTNQNARIGATVTLAVAAVGVPPLHFQWQRNGTNLPDNYSHISGAASSVLTIKNASTNWAGSYQVIVKNKFGSVSSSVATLNVGNLIILPSPQIAIFAPSNVVNLQAILVAGNSANASFQWSSEPGQIQPDQLVITDPTSTNTSVVFGFAGTYVLTATATTGTNVVQSQVTVTVGLNPNGVFTNVANFVTAPQYTNGSMFLTRFQNNPMVASNYYAAIDPTGSKLTFNSWKIANGIPTNAIPAAATNFMNGIVAATYFNSLDLGFGRRMIMIATNGNWAFAVSNYKTVDDAIKDTNKIATVTMDYSPVGNGTIPFTKFYVFSNDVAQTRVAAADLDGGGFKYVPALCIVCHGGVVGQPTNVSAHFLAFDLLNALDYSSQSNFTRAAQEPAFKLMNQAVFEIETNIAHYDPPNLSPAITNLILGWYSNFKDATQNDNFIPSGWQDANSTGILSLAGQAYLYTNVVAPSCRSCHETRSISRNLDFRSFTNWNANNVGIRADVFGGANITTPPIIMTTNISIAMPQARRTFERFWTSISPQPEPEILRDYLFTDLDIAIPALDPRVSTPIPIITGIAPSGSQLVISFSTSSGYSYRLESANDLSHPVWTPIGGTIAGNGDILQMIQPIVASQPQCFYRVVVQ